MCKSVVGSERRGQGFECSIAAMRDTGNEGSHSLSTPQLDTGFQSEQKLTIVRLIQSFAVVVWNAWQSAVELNPAR